MFLIHNCVCCPNLASHPFKYFILSVEWFWVSVELSWMCMSEKYVHLNIIQIDCWTVMYWEVIWGCDKQNRITFLVEVGFKDSWSWKKNDPFHLLQIHPHHLLLYLLKASLLSFYLVRSCQSEFRWLVKCTFFTGTAIVTVIIQGTSLLICLFGHV